MNESRSFDLSGGDICLDFANTRCSANLHSYSDLVAFVFQADLVNKAEKKHLLDLEKKLPPDASRVFKRALELRETVYRVFSKLAAGSLPLDSDLDILNKALVQSMPNLRLAKTGMSCCWQWSAASPSLDRPLWPLVRACAEILTSDRAGRVKECANEGCTWLFLDNSPSHRRKWCDMKTCGNRSKARRYYERHKNASD